MSELTFGEQVKVVLSRKGMTIKELAERIEEQTGKKMSRQNLTQRLSRDNFQEQDMRMIAGILECPLYLSILDDEEPVSQAAKEAARVREAKGRGGRKRSTKEEVSRSQKRPQKNERDITIGELLDIHAGLDAMERENTGKAVKPARAGRPLQNTLEYEPVHETGSRAEEKREPSYTVEELLAEVDALEAEAQEDRRVYTEEKEEKPRGWKAYLQRNKKDGEPEGTKISEEEAEDFDEDDFEEYDEDDMEIFDIDYGTDEDLYIAEGNLEEDEEEDTEIGDVNPYTGREYKTNSVRMHPERIGYVQVYDRADHRWTDMTEWAFLGYQERKKALLGNDYVPPIYLD